MENELYRRTADMNGLSEPEGLVVLCLFLNRFPPELVGRSSRRDRRILRPVDPSESGCPISKLKGTMNDLKETMSDEVLQEALSRLGRDGYIVQTKEECFALAQKGDGLGRMLKGVYLF